MLQYAWPFSSYNVATLRVTASALQENSVAESRRSIAARKVRMRKQGYQIRPYPV
jgi:hypothetical protein